MSLIRPWHLEIRKMIGYLTYLNHLYYKLCFSSRGKLEVITFCEGAIKIVSRLCQAQSYDQTKPSIKDYSDGTFLRLAKILRKAPKIWALLW